MNESSIIAALLTIALRAARPLAPPLTDDDWRIVLRDYEKFRDALITKTRCELPPPMKTLLEQVKQRRKERNA
jgi:hypothetical protein